MKKFFTLLTGLCLAGMVIAQEYQLVWNEDFTEESLRALLDEAGGFRVKKIWHTNDARPERADELWVNVICLAEKNK